MPCRISRARRLALAALLVLTAAALGANSTGAQPPAFGTISGTVTNPDGSPAYGMQVEAVDPSFPCPAGYLCGPQAVSGPTGVYTLADLVSGRYQVDVIDAGKQITVATATVTGSGTTTVNVRLPPAPVPSGTVAHDAARDLGYLNAERGALGLLAGIKLNTRWATECAAHDDYDRVNHVLEHPENPKLPDASAGGAWAGENSILAEFRWTRNANPWWTAPIHLIQLLTPSLSVIGIDDHDGFQCATTWPGMLRGPVKRDTIYTYPAQGAHGVPASENAQESPFVPGQFVGIPYGRTAGRELFVYLNLANESGQAQVKIEHASLAHERHGVAVRWVDNSTKTLGPYLSGGILLPIKPMRAHTTYTATVVVKDGSGSLRHSWSFTTS